MEWERVKEFDVCFLCLKNGHRTRKCPLKKPCGEGGCEARHHPTLHLKKDKPSDERKPYGRVQVNRE
jgi:hypothetical protein